MRNPEFWRNIWLEFTPARIIISPLVALGITYIVYLATRDSGEFARVLLSTMGTAIGFILFLWGTKQAAESVINEVGERTWVFQKMSSISAWEMSLGKLFGSTSYVWYSAFFFILAYIIGAFLADDTILALKSLLLMLMATIIGYSISIMMSLAVIKNGRLTGNTQKTSIFIISVIIALYIGTLAFGTNAQNFMMHWYSLPVSLLDFYLFSAAYLLFWSIVGLHRNMRTELQYDNGPLIWCVFLITLLIYGNGITLGIQEFMMHFQGNIFLWTSFLILSVFTYVSILAESFNTVIFRKLLDRLRKKDLTEASFLIPLWLPPLSGALFFAILLIIYTIFAGPSILLSNIPGTSIDLSLLPVAILLFIFRDLGVIGLIKSSGSTKADFYVIIYLALFYGLLPTIAGLLKVKQLLHVFLPVPGDNFMWQVLPVLIQFLAVAFLVVKTRYFILKETVLQDKEG